MTSKAQNINSVIKQRLETIDGTGLFINSVTVLENIQRIDESELPAVIVHRLGEKVEKVNSKRMDLSSDIAIDMHILASADIETLIADVKRALFLPDDMNLALGSKNLAQEFNYSGLEVHQREDGSISASAQITINCKYPEKYGDPDYVY